jgi:hypothetical protein
MSNGIGRRSVGRPRRRNVLGYIAAAVAIGAVAMLLAVTCGEDMLSGTGDKESRDAATATSSLTRGGGVLRAHLHLTVENAASEYAGEMDEDPWQSESWVTTAAEFDLVVTNAGSSAAVDPRIIVSVPEWASGVSGWQVTLDGATVLDGEDFIGIDPTSAGFGGGGHGVFEPSGQARFAVYESAAGSIGPHDRWVIHVAVEPAGVDDFEVHFDATSENYVSPNSHDVNVRPVDGGGSELEGGEPDDPSGDPSDETGGE